MGKQFYLTMTEWSDLTMTNMLYLLKHKHYFLCEKAVMREVFHDLRFTAFFSCLLNRSDSRLH